jgi:hypothetical protein
VVGQQERRGGGRAEWRPRTRGWGGLERPPAKSPQQVLSPRAPIDHPTLTRAASRKRCSHSRVKAKGEASNADHSARPLCSNAAPRIGSHLSARERPRQRQRQWQPRDSECRASRHILLRNVRAPHAVLTLRGVDVWVITILLLERFGAYPSNMRGDLQGTVSTVPALAWMLHINVTKARMPDEERHGWHTGTSGLRRCMPQYGRLV